MKTTLDQKTLSDAVAWAARALPSRPSTPVLAGILLEADADGLTLSVFDYDVAARAQIPADVAEPGRVLLPGRVLAEIVKSLPTLPVELAVTGMEATIMCGSAEFGLLTMPVDDYPKLPDPLPTVGMVDGKTLHDAAAQVTPAASHDDSLPMLVCCRIDIDGDAVTFAATDRYRIAARTFTWKPADDTGKRKAMIPARVLHDIARSVGAYTVEIGLSDDRVSFTSGGRTTTARLLDEKFIDYNATLNITVTSHAEVDVAPLIEAVKRVAVVADRGTPVRLEFTGDEVVLRAGAGDFGRGTEHLPAKLDGDRVEVAFQPNYLIDALAAIAVQHDTVRIGLQGPAKPTRFTPPGGDPTFRTLVMAIRLS